MNNKNNIAQREQNKYRPREVVKTVLPYVGLIFVFIFCLIGTNGKLVTGSNISNLIDQCFTVVLLSLGVAFIFSCGMMDMALGGIMAFAELIIGRIMINAGVPLALIILVGLIVAVICEMIVGAVSIYLRVESFIISMCISNICLGVVLTAISQNDLYIPYQEYSFLNNVYLKAAVLVFMIVLYLLIFHKTRLGRELKTIGGNRKTALQSGVQSSKAMMLAFVLAGVCGGIAALFGITFSGVLTANTGSSTSLNCMIALVLGGFPLTGGPTSRVISVVVGALTTTILVNGLSLMGIDASIASIFKGILFIVIISISYVRVKGAEVC